jgi:hypothetical protein
MQWDLVILKSDNRKPEYGSFIVIDYLHVSGLILKLYDFTRFLVISPLMGPSVTCKIQWK